MGNLVCVCAAKLVVSKIVSKETKWSYEKVKMAACVVGRARDCVRRSLAKAMLQLEENELWSHRGFCASGKLGRRCELVSIKVVQRWIDS